MPEPSTEYPRIPDNVPIREVLRLSQTDITPDPNVGLHYAAHAYDLGQNAAVAATDPWAAGEGAAKAGFLTIKADLPIPWADDWFQRSYAALPDDIPAARRERVATYLLEGRAWALEILKAKATFEGVRYVTRAGQECVR